MAVFIGLYNPKSPTNVGAVMRAAGCYQADRVCYTGGRFERAAQYQTDTKQVTDRIELQRVDSLHEQLPDGMKVVCVEFAEGATPLPGFVHPESAMYIFGPEDGSVSQDIVDAADEVVFVPTTGCMNLAAAVNVVLYDRLSKLPLNGHSDDLVKDNRDTNNRLKIR